MTRRTLALTLVALATTPPALADEPTPEQTAWIKENAIVLKTVEAGNGFDDLMPLKALIGDARIVSLGESTHGTREIFQMKHRLVEFLASEMGFTIFSIEANMPESYRVNDYVLHGKGDPKKLLDGMYFWTWNTQEVLDMIEWMREFNKAGKGRIEFTGFDMQTPDVAMKIVLDFFSKVDPGYRATTEATYEAIKSVSPGGGGPSFGVATGSFPVEAVRGKKIRYSGYIKTEDVTGDSAWAGLWWRVDGESGTLGFDNMGNRGPKGTTPWTRYEIELAVSKDAVKIAFGMLLSGRGTAWFDSLKVEIDGKDYEGEAPFDSDFESGTPKDVYLGGDGYEVAVDATTARTGKASLRMRYAGGKEQEGLQAGEAVQMASEVLRHLEAATEDYGKKASREEIDWAERNARVVLQCFQSRAGMVPRDLSMAANVKWILEHAPADTRIVLWAHNGHVNKVPRCMGAYLDRWYGAEQVVLGFACNSGQYTAVGDNGLASNDLKPAGPGSVGYYFHKTGLPHFILDLRQASQELPASSWLTKRLDFRSIGALASEKQFQALNVQEAFDALIYIDRTKATDLLR
jgi:erythromycin esterase-like protein